MWRTTVVSYNYLSGMKGTEQLCCDRGSNPHRAHLW
ncbi:MAG: hypothetical protein J07HN4v3_01978 [Halonotius sp. J07HN4]|nr:MAG: hypothetical protein J07HN4v3_01978 [Halonotius sp. J07HN4]